MIRSASSRKAGRAAADLQREAEAIGNWASRAGKEVQRSLDSANRSINQWAGNCGSTNDCNRRPRVERRDRWADRTIGTVPQRQSPPPDEAGLQQRRRSVIAKKQRIVKIAPILTLNDS